MTIRTYQIQVGFGIIHIIAIYMFNFQRNLPGIWIHFMPPASTTFTSIFLKKISFDIERCSVCPSNASNFAGFPFLDIDFIFIFMLA